MANVYSDTTTSIQLEESERDTLIKAHDILKDVRHEMFMQDNDTETYWSICGAVECLEDCFEIK